MDDTVVKLTQKLISLQTTSDNKKALIRTLELIKQTLPGFPVQEFIHNNSKSILFSNKNHVKKCEIILNAHLDVVPGKPEQFKPKIENDKLIGRGSYDMKAAAAVFVLLFKKLANKVSYPLGLQLVTDEETGGFNGTKYQIEQGVTADFVIAGENTDLFINNKSKGIIWLKLVTHGVSAHGAYPWLGENAIWKMNQDLNILSKHFPIPKKEAWQTTINLAKIETTNTAANKIPDKCEAFFDIRYIPEDKDTILKTLTSVLPDDTKAEILVEEPSQFTSEESIYIKQLQKAAKKITGKLPELVAKHGGSDIRFYTAKGIPGITFGPIGAGHHSDYEWVSIKSLTTYEKILDQFLTNS